MEFPVDISPFIEVVYNRNYITVDAAPAQYNDINCENADDRHIKLRFFMLYLPEQNIDSDVYFEGIINMMSYKNIIRNGRLVSACLFIGN